MNPLLRVIGYLKPYIKSASLAMVFLALVVIVDLAIPRLLQVIIDQGVVAQNMDVIVNTSLIMIGASILSALLALVNTVFSVKTAQSVGADLRAALFHKIQSFSFGNFDKFQTGRLLVRLTSDINQLQLVILLSLRLLVRAPLLIIGSIVLMIATNLQLAQIMLLLLPFTFVLTIIFIRFAQPLFLKVQQKLESLNQVLQENLAGIRVIKAFVRSDYANTRFDQANTALMSDSVAVSRLISVLFPIMILLMNLSTVAVIYFGGVQTIGGTLTIGEVLAFINYLLSTIFPLSILALVSGQLSAANASAERVMEIIDTPMEVTENSDVKSLPSLRGRVAFENVSFTYKGAESAPVLRNINLIAEPGQTVAILGATGSGKTSLIQLIPRFYDTTKGRVTVDGVDVRDVTQKSLRSQIGVSLQEVVLFSGTIRENISYGRSDASEEEIVAAAKVAEAHEFIMGFPEGYNTQVEQRGVNLSGGQKQRIAIARTLLVKPKILILDDSTRFIDVETEAKIHNALEEVMKETTSFIVAQRVSTVLSADKIVVLDNGEIVAEGTHRELMDSSVIYREIYDSQLGNGGGSS
jgi:ATP-binding cassette subfamily B multidrug efflux pump